MKLTSCVSYCKLPILCCFQSWDTQDVCSSGTSHSREKMKTHVNWHHRYFEKICQNVYATLPVWICQSCLGELQELCLRQSPLQSHTGSVWHFQENCSSRVGCVLPLWKSAESSSPCTRFRVKVCVPNNFILSHSKGKHCFLTLRVCVIPAHASLCGRERGKARLLCVWVWRREMELVMWFPSAASPLIYTNEILNLIEF